MSLDDVARVTKIQPRILERLEAGKLDGLPAEVFVRGFVRSIARCVGLDEGEALRRYAACGLGAGTQDLTPTVRALVEALADLTPGSVTAVRATPRGMQAVELIDLASGEGGRTGVALSASDATVEAELLSRTGARGESLDHGSQRGTDRGHLVARVPAAEVFVQAAPAAMALAEPANASKKRRGRHRKGRAPEAELRGALALADGVPRESLAVGTPPAAPPAVATADAASAVAVSPWDPKMPPIAVPGHRPGRPAPAAPTAPVVPSLVIDDADPESAELILEERAAALSPRRSFLPPILLDREDRFARQGGLTLAVILLLIAATLTLSYLMRRPSASGDGMTLRQAPVLHIRGDDLGVGRGPASLS